MCFMAATADSDPLRLEGETTSVQRQLLFRVNFLSRILLFRDSSVQGQFCSGTVLFKNPGYFCSGTVLFKDSSVQGQFCSGTVLFKNPFVQGQFFSGTTFVQ